MKHQLPSIHPFIRTDFIIESQEKKEKPYQYVFRETEHGLYYKKREQYESEHATLWTASLSISSQTKLEEVIALLQEYELVAVKENGTITGCIYAGDALALVHESYSYLEAYFHTMIEATEASVCIIDENGKTVVWTPGAERLFSIPKEDILGRDMKEFFSHDMLLNHVTLETGESFYQKQHQPREDLFVLINTSPVLLDGSIVGAVSAETDITSQVLLNQRLMQASTKIQELQQEVVRLHSSHDSFVNIRGSSKVMKESIQLAKKIAATSAPVLLLGETGVGKEEFAKAIHHTNQNNNSSFIALNCGAIPSSLFESELFGYEKGAFSGADSKGKKGKIELADGGTLFLDEIGDLPLDMQVKLLRVLQDKTYYPVGGTKQMKANCRVIAATNKDLERMVQEGTFREDLYYRLNILSITIPPLRERKDDILDLIHLFVYEFSTLYNRTIEYIAPHIISKMLAYDWPGNVRELRNTVERLVLLTTDGQVSEDYLPSKFLQQKEAEKLSYSLQDDVDRYERDLIIQAIKAENGNKLAAAQRLGISRATLYNKLKKLDI